MNLVDGVSPSFSVSLGQKLDTASTRFGRYFTSGDSYGSGLNTTMAALFVRAPFELAGAVTSASKGVNAISLPIIDTVLGLLAITRFFTKDLPQLMRGVSNILEHKGMDLAHMKERVWSVLMVVKDCRWVAEAVNDVLTVSRAVVPAFGMLVIRLSYWSTNFFMNSVDLLINAKNTHFEPKMMRDFVVKTFTTSGIYDIAAAALHITAVATGQAYMIIVAIAVSDLLSAVFDFGHSAIDYHKEATKKSEGEAKPTLRAVIDATANQGASSAATKTGDGEDRFIEQPYPMAP